MCRGAIRSASWTFLIHYCQASLQVALCRHAEHRVCRDVTGWVCVSGAFLSVYVCAGELSADASDVR